MSYWALVCVCMFVCVRKVILMRHATETQRAFAAAHTHTHTHTHSHMDTATETDIDTDTSTHTDTIRNVYCIWGTNSLQAP